MNAASSARLEIARKVARLYAAAPSVRAMMVAGSVARGTADEFSDIDLFVFWNAAPADPQREASVARARLRLMGTFPFGPHRGDLARASGLDVCAFAEPEFAGLTVGIVHRTVEGTEKLVADVLDRLDLWWEKHAMMAALSEGILLHGDRVVLPWKERAARYPVELARAIVERHAGIIGECLRDLCPERGLAQYDLFYEIVVRSVGILAALNRTYLETDKIRFKAALGVAAALGGGPPNLVERMNALFRADLVEAVTTLRAIVSETLALLAERMPDVDVSAMKGNLHRSASSWKPQGA